MAEQLKWKNVALHNVDIALTLYGAINRKDKVYLPSLMMKVPDHLYV
jgi:hypothetical protein